MSHPFYQDTKLVIKLEFQSDHNYWDPIDMFMELSIDVEATG